MLETAPIGSWQGPVFVALRAGHNREGHGRVTSRRRQAFERRPGPGPATAYLSDRRAEANANFLEGPCANATAVVVAGVPED